MAAEDFSDQVVQSYQNSNILRRYRFRGNKNDRGSLKPGKVLGEGASCRVILALRRSDNIKCAVKQIKRRTEDGSENEIFEVMWRKEQDILSQLEHPNIIGFMEAGCDDRDFFIVTEFNEGGELFNRIVNEEYEMTEAGVARIVREMLQAVGHMHRMNIVHRDLKPENWLFRTNDSESSIVLIDFGTALEVEDETRYTDLVGTPFYLAPESATNQPYRTGAMLKSSDIWAIGVIAYICLTGQPPFHGTRNADICRAIVKKKLRFPGDIELSQGFKDFCSKSLKKRWNQRLSMDDALMHPWVIGETATENRINLDTVRSLRQFQHQTKLKKAVSGILAQNMGQGPEQRVREHFNRLDIDGDNALDLDELRQLIKDLGFHEVESDIEAQRILEEADTDNDGSISFEEFATVWQRKLLTVNEQYIHAVFNVLDSNGDGFIDAEELMGVLEGYSREDVEQMIEEVDGSGNGDGVIDFQEFKKAMKEQIEAGKIDVNETGAGTQVRASDLSQISIVEERLEED